MFCENCGTELADDASFCSNCGNRVKTETKPKNIYIALILTVIFTGLGSIYAGNLKKGAILIAARLGTSLLTAYFGIFFYFMMVVWVLGFYEAYRDVQIANGHPNPKLADDFKKWDRNKRIIAGLIISIVLIFAIVACISFFVVDNYTPEDFIHQSTSYHSGSGSGSSGSHSHYGGVDDSPYTIAKNDPDWYYDHYEYGDNPDIDDYLESQGY